MFRATDMVLIAVMVSAAAFTYTTKHGAEAELSKLRRMETAIRLEEDTIDVLKADWSLLTQPSRLQRLAEAFHSDLQLVPMEAHQIGRIDDLPEPRLRIEDLLDGPSGEVAADGIDTLATGAVTQ